MGHRIVNLTAVLTIQSQAPASMILSGNAPIIPPTFLLAPVQQGDIQRQIESLENDGYDMVHASETYLLFFKDKGDELDGQEQTEQERVLGRIKAGLGSGRPALPSLPIPVQGSASPEQASGSGKIDSPRHGYKDSVEEDFRGQS